MHGQAQACPRRTRGAPARPAPEIMIGKSLQRKSLRFQGIDMVRARPALLVSTPGKTCMRAFISGVKCGPRHPQPVSRTGRAKRLPVTRLATGTAPLPGSGQQMRWHWRALLSRGDALGADARETPAPGVWFRPGRMGGLSGARLPGTLRRNSKGVPPAEAGIRPAAAAPPA